ncbi:uncharacterized protein LOC103277990 [Anolis carolinensis]|uniref:uncharacterized protein LOC103277990 n=1 Tax=Anolis carolinensis TaxID=28377 RepID=UPI002F2B862C
MALQYVKNQKGRDQLLYKGYLHKKQRASAGKILWKCADYAKYQCKGRVYTCDGQVIKYFRHRHPPDVTAGKTKQKARGPKEMIPRESVGKIKQKVSGSKEITSNETTKKTKRKVSGPKEMKPSETMGKTKRRIIDPKEKIPSQESTHKVAVMPTDAASPGVVTNKKPCIQNNPKQTIQRLRACLNALRQSTSDLRTPTSAKRANEDLVAALPQASPGWPENSTEGVTKESFKATPSPHEEISEAAPIPTRECHSTLTWTHQEANRLKFRTNAFRPGQAPEEILLHLTDAAQQWLCPQEHSKEWIVDMVVLEEFLDVLPVDMRMWVRAREPSSSKEAAQLAEAYFRECQPDHAIQDQITFGDVSVSFTTEEWALLNHGEKSLYWNVMHQNYDNVTGLGSGSDDQNEGVDFGLAMSEPLLGLSAKHGVSSPSPEQDLIRENCLERQLKHSTGKERCFVYFREGLKKLVRGRVHPNTKLRPKPQCVYTDCEKQGESTTVLESQKHLGEKDPQVMIVSGELHETSEQRHFQNFQNSVNEVQKSIEGWHSNCLETEEEEPIVLKKWLWDPVLQDVRPGEETLSIEIDGVEQEESLTLVNDKKILDGEHAECIVLLKESLEMSREESSHSPEQDLQTDAAHINSKPGNAGLTTKVGLTSEHQRENGARSEEHTEKPVPSGNTMGESIAEPGPEMQCMGINGGNQDENSTYVDSLKNSCSEDLNTCLKCEKQSPHNLEELSSSKSGEIFNGFSASTKHKKNEEKGRSFNEEKERSFNCRGTYVLGAHARICPRQKHKHISGENQNCYRLCNCRLLEQVNGITETSRYYPLKQHIQTCDALHQPMEEVRISSDVESSLSDSKGLEAHHQSSFLTKMVAEPSLAQLIGILQQVAADTAEIKSSVSSLQSTITGIQSALGSLSGCTDETEHRISQLEDSSRNTKSQLLQHCNDIKTIEAKLGGKAVQTNVIAGLWSSLKISRGASPLNLSPNT